jgi:hypothetical protein
MVAQTVGINMPPDFAEVAYNDIANYVGPFQPRFADAFRHYAGAWNGVAFRFKSASEADDAFQTSLSQTFSAENRYGQELALFQFFTNASSVLDCCAYALHAIGNMLKPEAFPLDSKSLRAADFVKIAKHYARQFEGESLSKALTSVNAEPNAEQLREIRNFLSHRAATVRAYTMSTTPPLWGIEHFKPSSGLQSLAVDEQFTGRYRSWIAPQLGKVFADMLTFLRSRLRF